MNSKGADTSPAVGLYEEKIYLQHAFLQATHALTALMSEQTQAVIDGATDPGRFDMLIHDAQENKDIAKYAWMAYLESHRSDG